ncbi:MAG: alpha/beta hydrolase domain-containing protein [Massilia sp.]
MAAPLLLGACASHLDAGAPAAQVERFDIISRTPAFGGARFDEAGDYETIVAVAHMRINPRHPANRGIVDLDKAAAPDGWVRYASDVVILRPRAPAGASRVLLLDVPNRGGKLLQQMVNEGSYAIGTPAGAGTGYTMRRGHTLVWIGWQGDVKPDPSGRFAGAALPLASIGAQPITGQRIEEAVFDDIKPVGSIALAYPAASLSQEGALLTVRTSAMAAPQRLPADAWRYTSANTVELTSPKGYDAGAIYQFQYEARDPKVMGLGFAALRDVTSYLKSGEPDAAGQANPLADIKPAVTIAAGVSQSGRVLRDLIWQGFNADPRGGRVFDGVMPIIAGSRKSFVNARFAEPGRNATQHAEHLTPGDQFPFSYAVTTDPVSGRTDGIFARCTASHTCPKLMHVDSSTEFWQGRASLVTGDGAGRDIALPAEVRAYLMSSTQHTYTTAPSMGICKNFNNPASQAPLLRALLERLVGWSRDGKAPPASRYPRHADGMLVAPERGAVGFPDLAAAGLVFPAVINELAQVDYAAVPPRVDAARRYQLFVPMTDLDGHDLAGIRSPDVAVPLATYTGWNLRRGGFAEGQLCGLNGSMLALPATPKPADPRQAISQRYRSRLEYAKAVALSARELRDQGLLLDDDANRYIERAKGELRVP